MKMKILLNAKSKYCGRSNLYYINNLIENQRKKNVALKAYLGKETISTIDADYSVKISLTHNKKNKELFIIYVCSTNTIIYCTRFEIIKFESN